MPDGVAILRAAAVAIGVTAALGMAGAAASRREPALGGIALLAAFSWGVVAGLWCLPCLPAVPPRSGLDRFLLILMPVALAIEAEAACGWLGGVWLAVERGCVALVALPVLLHGSVWLGDAGTPWPLLPAVALVFWATWEGVSAHVRATGDGLVAGMTAAALAAAGAAIMMAGWLKGGTMAIPLAAALAGAALVCRRGTAPGTARGVAALTAVGLVALFGVVTIGRCFGRLGTAEAALLFLAPSLAAIADGLGRSGGAGPAARTLGSVRYRVLVGLVPLVVVLVVAKGAFDARMGRLLREMTPVRAPR